MLRIVVLLSVVSAVFAGCVHSETQWMKVNEPYTTAEFQRDHAACSKRLSGELDEDCMRGKGWVAVNPSRADRATDTPPPPPVDYRHKR
ncbi:MAG TPA: hypothetical protein VHZ49_13685 [Methylomirabilota bacterium]|jgi:hypothetical protein|nr:hypothetical protein [Methylomirabilota bacterium]